MPSYFVIVVVQLSGIYGSKPTESEGDSPRTRTREGVMAHNYPLVVWDLDTSGIYSTIIILYAFEIIC